MKKTIIRVDNSTTLDSLAEKYHTTPLAIKNLNNLNSDIFVGMRLVIEENQGEYYTVQPFDTLDSIARKFSADLQRIKDLNGLDRVFIGQKIFIPR